MGRKKTRTPTGRPAAASPASAPPAPAAKPQAPPYVPRVAPTPAPEPDLPQGGEALAALGLLLVAAAIRFHKLGDKGLWFDEIHTLTNNFFPQPPGSPHRLFFLIDGLFQKLGSNPTLGVRIYPAIAGAITAPILHRFVSRLHSRLAGWIAASALLLQPFHLFHSQEARFYAPMALYSLLALWGTLEFALEPRRRRFAWLGLAGAADLLAWANHPSAQAFVLAHAASLYCVALATPWGLDAARQAFPPLREKLDARKILGGAGALAAVALPLASGTLRAQARKALQGGWDETPNVDLTLEFFFRHLLDFGWDPRLLPLAGRPAGWLSAAAALWGLALIVRRRPALGSMLLFILAASFLAIFRFKTETYYQTKYAAFLFPIVLAGFGAGAASGVARIARALSGRLGGERSAMAVAAGITALLLTAAQAPAAAQYFSRSKMPLRSQFQWLNQNEPQGACVYIYGHAGYPASLYKSYLASRHELQYLPWVECPGRVEAETMIGSAASGRPTYFAYCWPWDMPPFLMKWLKSEAQVVARFESIEGGERDGILFKLLPPAGSEHRSADRPGYAIDGFRNLGRPRIMAGKDGGLPRLAFNASGAVEYRILMESGRSYRVEIEGETQARGFHFLSVSGEGGAPIILGGPLEPGLPVTWSGNLVAPRASGALRVRYVSDYAKPKGTEREFYLRRIAVRPVSSGDPPPNGEIQLPPLHALGEGKKGGMRDTMWQSTPPGAITVGMGEGEDFMRLRLAPDAEGEVRTEMLPVIPGGLLHFRSRARMSAAFGYGATMNLVFFKQDGSEAGKKLVTSAPMSCDADWDPWIGQLIADPWETHEILVPAPRDAVSCVAAMIIWKSTNSLRYAKATNEIDWGPIEHVSAPNPYGPAKENPPEDTPIRP